MDIIPIMIDARAFPLPFNLAHCENPSIVPIPPKRSDSPFIFGIKHRLNAIKLSTNAAVDTPFELL